MQLILQEDCLSLPSLKIHIRVTQQKLLTNILPTFQGLVPLTYRMVLKTAATTTLRKA